MSKNALLYDARDPAIYPSFSIGVEVHILINIGHCFVFFVFFIVETTATGLGYEVTYTNMAQAATVVCVHVPASKMDFYWIGLADKFFYIYSKEIE